MCTKQRRSDTHLHFTVELRNDSLPYDLLSLSAPTVFRTFCTFSLVCVCVCVCVFAGGDNEIQAAPSRFHPPPPTHILVHAHKHTRIYMFPSRRKIGTWTDRKGDEEEERWGQMIMKRLESMRKRTTEEGEREGGGREGGGGGRERESTDVVWKGAEENGG